MNLQDMPKTDSGTLEGEHTIAELIKTPQQRHPAKIVPHRSKTLASTCPTEEHLKCTPQSVQREAPYSEGGIRRVQGVVNLDGAEDVIVEARLLRMLNEDFEIPK